MGHMTRVSNQWSTRGPAVLYYHPPLLPPSLTPISHLASPRSVKVNRLPRLWHSGAGWNCFWMRQVLEVWWVLEDSPLWSQSIQEMRQDGLGE